MPCQAAGQASSVGTYATGIEYAAHGGLKQMVLGTSNHLTEETCYNSRLQPSGIRVGTASTSVVCANPGGDLLNLGFGYGSATANNGNVASQTILANGVTFSQSYGYL